ncbi:MAG: hypothetical protein NT113_22900 [Hyphomicrobiales bacterium]|nr:hypothetical protein [Hyphomicrobiales bacterium]
MRITRKQLEAAARECLAATGFEYAGESLLACAESKDPKVYNPRAAKAVADARKILKAGAAR